jgi:predicted AAA+ superfamily ATPase
MAMKRTIDTALTKWSKSEKRKVLLVRGARQVGKTYSIRRLGECFQHFLEVNFEEEKEIKSFFSSSLNPAEIVEKLSAYYSTPIVPGKTLVFFDEIQSCPEAMSSLRFFYEKMPELHVAAAGSLLEFALEEIPSMGVGRITSLFMYSMSFIEFLNALGEHGLVTMLAKADLETPLDEAFHNRLVDRLKTYLTIGGMPEVVQRYVDSRDLLECQTVLDDLIVSFMDDFAKYKHKTSVERLEEVFRNIALQSGQKFKYSTIDKHVSSGLYKEALNLLVKAGVVHKIYHTSAQGLPLGAQVNEKKFKACLFDIGLHQRLMGLELSELLVAYDFKQINRGGLLEVFAGLELIAYGNPRVKQALYYWHREARSSNAEVDYVIQRYNQVVPIEVKAGTKGQMQSMHLFLQKRNLDYGIRLSLENFCQYDNIQVYPVYAISKL